MNINGYPNYTIDSSGKVMNIKKGSEMRYFENSDKYLAVKLWNDGNYQCLTIHRLIALHYIDRKEGCNIVDHIDRNRQNNNIENLRWVTPRENCLNRSAYKNSKLKLKYITITGRKNEYYLLTMRQYKVRKLFRIDETDLNDVIQYRDNILLPVHRTGPIVC